MGVIWPGPDIDHSPPSSAKVKNEWREWVEIHIYSPYISSKHGQGRQFYIFIWKSCLASISFLKIECMRVILYLEPQLISTPTFQFLTSLGEIWYKRPTRISDGQMFCKNLCSDSNLDEICVWCCWLFIEFSEIGTKKGIIFLWT